MSLFHLISPLLRLPAISVLLQSIVNQFLSNSYCLTLVFEEPIEFKLNVSFSYIVPNGTAKQLRDQLLEVSERGCSDYIVNMKDPLLFMSAFDMVSKMGNIRRSDRKIIFLPHSENTSYKNISTNLFSMKETNFVANIVMISPNITYKELQLECEIFEMVTHKFGGADAEMNQLLYLNRWDSCTMKFQTNDLFLHNMSNLFGKTVKLTCFTYKPFVLLDLDPSLAPKGRDGTELRLVEEFCSWVICTVELIREAKDHWGEVFENGTGTGLMGNVVEDRADMAIGALYSWYEEYLQLDLSSTHSRSTVTCIAPSPKLLASWEMPLMPFTWHMWCAVLMTFLFASIGLFIATKGCFSDEVFLTVFGIMISQSRNNAALNWRVRSVTGWLLIASLILVSAYGGGLASTFTVPNYEASVDTVRDLVERNMEWGATHDAWIFSLSLSSELLVKKLVNLFRVYPAEELKRRSFTGSMAFAVERLQGGCFALPDYLTQEALLDMTLMLEDFYFGNCVVMMRKSSPYTEKLNEFVGRLHQSGLLLAWETQVVLKHMNFEVQQEVTFSRHKSDVGFRPLNVQNVVGVFIIYVIGITLSILLFILERFTYRINTT